MPFIRAVRLTEGGSTAADVIELQVSEITTGRLQTASVAAVHAAIRRGVRYRAFDERTHKQTDVEARIGFGGSRHVVTVEAGLETTDLVRLPKF